MERFRPIILNLWREACRHIEIEASAAALAGVLEPHLPFSHLAFQRFEADHRRVSTVAVAPPAGESLVSGLQDFTDREWRRLIAWAKSDTLVHRGRARRLSYPLNLFLSSDVAADLLAAPLQSPGGPVGLLILISRAGQQFDARHREMLSAFAEPLAVALDNDRRLHEMAALREAAEADKQSLLTRMGRKEIGDTIVGEQTGLAHVMERVRLVSRSDVPVLILGETGTGKELIARAIHSRNDRKPGPFLRVNCGAIPPELIDSHLFGHERGSFTGASDSRLGWFERASGGTLFLDEIGELPLGAQVRLLRILQDGLVERVGGQQSIHVDVRVVAATHRDLYSMVREGRFREDLWYRINVFPMVLPSLRERKDDIPSLARHFARRAATHFGLAPVDLGDETIRLLQAYSWPGNIRELAAVIDRAAILGEGHTLEVATALGLSGDPFQPAGSPTAVAHSPVTHYVGTFPSLNQVMRRHIELALAKTRGRIEGRQGAAALLKINPHTLRARMRKLGISWADFREHDSDATSPE